ncbi:alanine racemase C-terminal domain-containing protein [Microbacterium sp. NIBRBAC000506063]|uniref:alanine racemase C-terminal domain-containing protein n=1 Tax=Microbacterium sp. NIBRBAC000506063 TaxID=2734618 RepID=UPI001BB5F3DC|nr:alanine racemase C-terminal domain-containing protein [Microbacterium sp. NIBRBAC000506063]QTV79729.1 hypothetical protein KAE78_13400 [Microbacterium sp. NIBRBAC000506063]
MLRTNATAAVQRGGTVADLRGDAFGHGVAEVAPIVHDAGARALLVGSGRVAEALRRSGLPAIVEGEPDIDGDALYGLPGSGLDPVMRLSGQVLSTKPLRAGEAVSYGYTYRATVDTTVALVTGGYAQGVVRALGNRVRVQVGGELVPIVGRVAMDVCVVDLQAPSPAVADGTEVVFFGGSGPVKDGLAAWAEATGLSAAELITVAGSKAVREWEH